MSKPTVTDEPTLIEKKDDTTLIDPIVGDTTIVEEKDDTVIVDLAKELKKRKHEENKRLREEGKRRKRPRACKGVPLERFHEEIKRPKKKESDEETKKLAKPKVLPNKKSISSSEEESYEESEQSSEGKKPKGCLKEEDKKKLKSIKKSSEPTKSFRSYPSSATKSKCDEHNILKKLPFKQANESEESENIKWWYYEDEWVGFNEKETTLIEEKYQEYITNKKKRVYNIDLWKSNYSFNFKKLVQTNENKKAEQFIIRRLLTK